MKPRTSPLKIPDPLRHPYHDIEVNGHRYVMRLPSLHALTKLLRDGVPQQTIGKLLTLAEPEMRSNVFMVLQASPEICEVFGAVIGLSWSDPQVQLDSAPSAPIDVSSYGSAVFEELHEHGWTLAHVATLGLALLEHFVSANRVDSAVSERAAFFLRPKEPSTQSESLSSASTSAGGAEEPSTN